MEKNEILIYMTDRRHAHAIGRYISTMGVNIKVSLLGTEEEAKEGMQNQRLLLSDVLMPGRYLYLSENRNEDAEGEERRCLYKYLPADVLIDELRYQGQALSDPAGGKGCAAGEAARRSVKLIAFVSGAGGTGSSVVAIAAGRALAQSGGNVLYLNMERINAADVYSGRAPEVKLRSISDYTYKVLSGKQVVSEKGFTYCDHWGVRYFYEEEDLNPLAALSREEMRLFILHLMKEGVYDYILVDLPGVFSQAESCLLEYCSKALLIGDGSPVSCLKNRRLLRLMESEERGRQPLWFKEALNKQQEGDLTEREDVFYIRQQDEAFHHTGASTQILTHTRFTEDIQAVRHWIEGSAQKIWCEEEHTRRR